MPGVATQPDLFAAPEPPPEPAPDPLASLNEMLTRLAAAPAPPWPNLSAAMAEEYRALALAREAGPEGAALAQAILQQTERLLAMTD